MQERIKAVRKSLKMTQKEFGARLGVTGSAVNRYETGLSSPSDSVVLGMVRAFGVSEIWLRTGEGEMFPHRSQNEELALFLADIMADEEESIRKRFILALSHMGPAQWQAISDFCKALMG